MVSDLSTGRASPRSGRLSRWPRKIVPRIVPQTRGFLRLILGSRSPFGIGVPGRGFARPAGSPLVLFTRAAEALHIADELYLTDAEAEALAQELGGTINYARYPLSPRIQTLRAILGKLRPEPAREPLPPRKVYEPPSKGRWRRRG